MKAICLLFLLPFSLFAQEISEPWMRKPVINMTAAFMKIKNPTAKDINLLKVTGPDASFYEIHTHTKVDGVMKMRQIKSLKIPANSTVTLKPMGLHIMVLEIPRPKVTEMTGELTLHFDNGKTVKVKAPLK